MAPKSQKNLAFSVLLDYYGPVLTDKQRAILTEYYDQDLSLAEIAENYGISRQGVRDARLRAPLFPGGQRDLLYPITLRQILPDPVGGFLLGKTAGFPRLGQTLIPFHWDHLEFLYLYYIPGKAKAQEENDKNSTNNCNIRP